MFCLEAAGGVIHVDQRIRSVRTRHQSQPQVPPAWLHSFLESEDYLLKCPSKCFSGKVKQDLGDRLPRSHRKTYFCTECPEEGAICLGRVIERHLRHPILKVRKVTGMEGSVVKVGDIETLLNISYVAQHSTPNKDLAFVKLKTYRQSLWGAGCKQEVPCFECLQAASTDRNSKYCSIKCAYPNTVEAVANRTSTVANLQPMARSSTGPKSCRITRGSMHGKQFAAGEPQIQLHHPAPPKSSSALQPRSGRQPSKGWFSRMRNFFNFGTSKKTSSPTETVQHVQLSHSPSTVSDSPDRWSSCQRNFVGTRHVKESQGSKDQTSDRTHLSRFSSRTTENTKLQPRDNEKVKGCHQNSSTSGSFKEVSLLASAEGPEDSCLPNSSRTTCVSRPGTSRVNGLNVKAGPVTKIAWRSKDSGGHDEMQQRWEDVRNQVLNSMDMGYSENESEPVEVLASSFGSTAPHARASHELAAYSGPCKTAQALGFAAVITSKRGNAGIPRTICDETFTSRRNELFEMRGEWGE